MKAKPTNWQEMLKLAKVMFESGKHQADLREEFGDVRGQKLFYLLMLNQAFPGIKLFDLTDKEIMQLHFTKLIRLGNRSCSDSLARIQRQDATAGRELTQPLTEKEFAAWVKECIETTKEPKKKKISAMVQKISESSLELTHDDFCEVVSIPGDMVQLVKDHLNKMSDSEVSQIVETTRKSRAKGGTMSDGSFWANT